MGLLPRAHLQAEPRTARGGSALVPALMVVMAIGVLSAVWLQLSIDKHREIRTSSDAKRAFYLAEAGIAESFLGLVSGKSGNVGSDLVPASFADGLFWVTTEDGGKGRIVLKSTGLCGSGRAALSIVVEKVVETVASLGVFGQRGVRVQAGAVVDSYDSETGSYDPAHPGRKARVGCNEGIEVRSGKNAPTRILGDAQPGPEHTVVVQPGAQITGSLEPRQEQVPLPPLEPPAFPRERSVVHKDHKVPLTLPTGEYGLHVLRIGTKAEVTLSGPATVVVDQLWVETNGSFVLDGRAGDVRLYVLDCASLKGGSKLSTRSREPASVSLLIGAGTAADRDGNGTVDPPLVLEASGAFHGTIYAPNTEVSVPPGLEVFGAVAGQAITVRGKARVHFDEALVDLDPEEVARPRFSCWRIVELPDVPLVAERTDPLAALEQAGIEPLPAKNAHYDIGVAPPTSDPDLVLFTDGLPGLDPPIDAEIEPLSAAGAALVSQIDQAPPLDSSDLKSILKDASPLEDGVMVRAILRAAPMDSGHLRDVLRENAPLSDLVLETLLADGATQLDSGHVRDVLEASMPLSTAFLEKLLASDPMMKSGDLKHVLSDAAPLSQTVLDRLPSLVPSHLDAKDLLDVLGG